MEITWLSALNFYDVFAQFFSAAVSTAGKSPAYVNTNLCPALVAAM
jgi:hypothetical protein